MKDYNYKKLRNVGLIGHGATGKTSLAEALLFYTNNTDRLGKIEEGNTVMDYEQEEKRRGISLSTSVASFEENDTKINIVDMPGYFDFQGEVSQGMRAVDIATIVVCAVSGVQVGTEKAWDYCEKIKLPRAFFINKMDRENADFDKTLEEMKNSFGMSIVPIQYPIGKESNFTGIVNVISKTAVRYNPKTAKVESIDIPDEMIDKIEYAMESIKPITVMLSEGMTVDDIAKEAMKNIEISKLDESEIEYRCNCSKERVEKAIISTGKESLEEMIEAGENVNVECHFCDKSYTFTPDDIIHFPFFSPIVFI